WDVWAFSIDARTRVNLTRDGKKDGLRYGRPFVVDPEAKGLDLAGTLHLSCMEEWTKKSGIVAIQGGKPGAKRLAWGDATYDTLLKAKQADRFVYTRESSIEAPEYYATDRDFSNPRKLTNAAAQQAKYQWSAGSILVDYTSTKGKKLQGALFLPANYEPGKRYPTIVYIYERLSQGLSRFSPPRASGFDRSTYTSNGYAVFMPDIAYPVNDPGRSACWCVLPGLEAAIATGVVDRDRVGLHGHSWGG